MLIIFSTLKTQCTKYLYPQGKPVNAEFYEGVMDCFLKNIQLVCPAVFWSRDFFLLLDNVPAHKAASVHQFSTPKNVKNLYPPPSTLQIYLRPTILCSPS